MSITFNGENAVELREHLGRRAVKGGLDMGAPGDEPVFRFEDVDGNQHAVHVGDTVTIDKGFTIDKGV